ncbi:MAG: PAS domain S-box protein [Thermoanaerobaculia bacterium]|nr:PAS domain S-box protein [Thermoanaerobaculia bacterium]
MATLNSPRAAGGAGESEGGLSPSGPRSEGFQLFHRPLLPPSGAHDRPLLRRQLRWLIGLRVLVITSVLGVYLLLSLLPDQPLGKLRWDFLVVVAAAAYGASLAYLLLLNVSDRHVGLLAHFQFLGDIALITSLVYYFGGVTSPFSMLYLIVISISAVLLRRRAAILVANIAYLAYAGTLLGFYFNWFTSPHPSPDPVTAWRLAYALGTHLLGFYGVAILTSYLAGTVTEAERELEEKSENLAELRIVYRDVIQSISSGLITTDLAGAITSVNRIGEQLLHVGEGELLGHPIHRTGLFSHPAWLNQTRECHGGERLRRETEIQLPNKSSGEFLADAASLIHIGYSLTPLNDAQGGRTGYIIVFQDLTEWRHLQEELRLKDRMAAVGQMAAGLAHEIGNPLAAISGSVQMLAPAVGGDPQQVKLVGILTRESQRLDRTVKSFLQFARPTERSNTRFDIAGLLSEHVELLHHSPELSTTHRVELELDPPSAMVMADADQISQIFWNLVRNALRAMPEGGTLRIRGHVDQGIYRLRVTDTGRGMGEEERSRLFQPFKSLFDGGSGIGMAIVYRIIEEHGGNLNVDSFPGMGTTITVELPIAKVATPTFEVVS